ncbi:MAG TPA: glycosyltransferase family 39 protein [Terriglobales bacterium]|nr:glycosyltransferase family 39 protein [Terriglobales bacterium]
MLKLTRTIDLHPPLSYLLVRCSFAVFGVSAWSCRLPFFIAFLASSALLYFFVSRLLSPIYGLIATLIVWSSPYAHLATDARPYALILCFSALLLVSWHQVVKGEERPNHPWALATILVGGVGLLLSHVLGVLAYGAFLAAEIVRLWKRRKPDWRLWVALLVPMVAVLSYLPLLRTRSQILFSEYSQASPRRLAICYWEHVRYLVTPLALIVLMAVVWPVASKRSQTALQWGSRLLDVSLSSLLFCLFLVPLQIEILFARTGTPFYERYGVVALIPCAIFPTLLLGYRTRCNQLAGGGVVVLLAAFLILNTSGKAWLIETLSNFLPPTTAARLIYLVALPPIVPPPLKLPAVPSYLESAVNSVPTISHLEVVDPSLPLVAGSGPTFLELDKYQNAALKRRLYLLTNHKAASDIVHNTVFDNYEIVKAAFPITGQVEPYCAFLRQHSQFLVLGGYNYPDTWLLRKLELDGARLSILGHYDDGVIEEHQLYRVSIESENCGAQ